MKLIENLPKFIIVINCIFKHRCPSMLSISRKIEVTHSHVNHVVNRLEEEHIIKSEIIGRTRKVKLTPKGLYIAKHLNEVLEVMEYGEQRILKKKDK